MRKLTYSVLLLSLISFIAIPAAFCEEPADSEQPYEQAQTEAAPAFDDFTFVDPGEALAAPASDEAEAAQPQAEAASEQQSPQKLVTSIEVIGNKSISSNTIISKIKTRIGSPYSDNIVTEDIKRLYLLGYFSDINIDKEDYKDGVKIIITVAERPIIEKITFEGMKHTFFNRDKLMEIIKSKEKQYLDYPTLKEDAASLKKQYEKKGFNDAYVDYRVEVSKDANRADVVFVVDENLRFKVRDVNFEGNKYFTAKRLIKIMKTRHAWLFNPGALKEEVLAEDMEKLKSFYQREGFADVKVENVVERQPKKRAITITVKIDEGKKYEVGDIAIQGNSAVLEDVIRAQIKECSSGKVFSQDAMNMDISNIQSVYFDRGYIFAGIQEATSLNPETGKVDILYTVTENEIAYVDKINIKGNIKTKDLVIRRELRIHPGEQFDGEKLRRSKERLQNLGFFEEVSYGTEPTDIPNKRDLTVEVKEMKTGAFSFGGGYSTIDEFLGFVEIEQKNFDWKNWPYFTGDGQNLRLRAKIGTVSDEYSVGWTEPWMLDYPVSFGFDVYRRSHDRESDIGYGYDETRTGGDLRLGKELTEYLRGALVYRFESIEIANILSTATWELRKETGQNSISSLLFGLTYDKRDNVFDATKGYVLNGSVEGAGGPFGGDKDFMRFIGSGAQYFPLFKGSVISLSARLGLADAFGDSTDLPIYERFFAGGGSTVRGYEERKIGPLDAVTNDPIGGNALLVSSAEYTYPIFGFLKLAAFFDAGNVWKDVGDLGSGGFKSSVGFGVRVKTPMGPVKVDYGIPLSKQVGEEDKSSGRFHFSIGSGF